MLIRSRMLERIRDGEVDLQFRRWKRPTVKAGGGLTTAIGMLAIGAVDVVEERAIDDTQARRAGHVDRAALLDALGDRAGAVYRIEVAYAGEDPRDRLRRRDDLDAGELADVRGRLDRLDRASREGPWTRTTLRGIAAEPGRVARELAAELGRETAVFKRDVRKLKALGLTVSLEVGYELSPRGRVVLDAIEADSAES